MNVGNSTGHMTMQELMQKPANYVPSHIPTTSLGAGGANTNGLSVEELAWRKLHREMSSRIDNQTSRQNLLDARQNRLDLTGGDGLAARGMSLMPTEANIRQANDILRDLIAEAMENEQEDSVWMRVLQDFQNIVRNEPQNLTNILMRNMGGINMIG